MNDEQISKIVDALGGHGDQIGGNLVRLKQFTERLQGEQQEFLRQLSISNEASQAKAAKSATWSAIAAGAAAIAAIVQALVAINGTPQQLRTVPSSVVTPQNSDASHRPR